MTFRLTERKNPRFKILGLSHVAIVVSDMKRTVDFYQGVLGFPLIKTTALGKGDGQHFFFDMGDGKSSLAFFYFPTAKPAEQGVTIPKKNVGVFTPGQPGGFVTAVGSMNHIAFNVEPDALLEYKAKLEAAGIFVAPVLGHYDDDRAPGERRTAEGTWLRSIYFRDPDGIQLEFACWGRPMTDADVNLEPATSDTVSPELHRVPD
jgi:catechol 2,3-dioxygenase-like lactoylglutathione lyase family enzyme